MRRLAWALPAILGVMALIAGGALYLFPASTRQWFAFTIDEPLTAMFFGAGYVGGGACVFLLGRVGVSVRAATGWVLVLVAGMLLVTIDGWASLQWSNPATWVWTITYGAAPPLIVAAMLMGNSDRGLETAASNPRASAMHTRPATRFALLTTATIAPALGTMLLVWPETAGDYWPWPLASSAYTGAGGMARYVGVWLVTLGAMCVTGLRSRQPLAAAAAHCGLAVFAACGLASLLMRFDEVRWTSPSSWFLATGFAGLIVTSHRANREIGAAIRSGHAR